MIPLPAGQKGLALLMTLSMIALMVPIALTVNLTTRETVVQTALTRDDVTLHHMAMSALALGQTLLIQDRLASDADTLSEPWADPQRIETHLQALPFENGRLTLAITDEKARLQVNALLDPRDRTAFNPRQQRLWVRFLSLIMPPMDSASEGGPEDVVNALKDWLDAGDADAVTGFNGAESAYYEALAAPYTCANAPIRHSDEMRAIRWITPALFGGDGERPGIARFVTAYGLMRSENGRHYDGKINLNTADLPVLKALMPVGLEDLATAIVAYRDTLDPAESAEVLADPHWYRNAPGCAALDLDPAVITTSSHLFRLVAAATLHDRRLTLEAVAERYLKDGRWQCRLLSRFRPIPVAQSLREKTE